MNAHQPTAAALATALCAFTQTDWASVYIDGSGRDVSLVLRTSADHIGDAERQTIHGGIVAGFLEDAALIWLRALGVSNARPIDFTTEFVRGATATDLAAAITVIRRGRRVINLRVDAYQDKRSDIVAVAYGLFSAS